MIRNTQHKASEGRFPRELSNAGDVEETSSSSEPNGPNEIKRQGPGVTEPEGTENSGDSLTELTENLSLDCSTTNPEGRVGAVDCSTANPEGRAGAVDKGEGLSLSVAMTLLPKQKCIAGPTNLASRRLG